MNQVISKIFDFIMLKLAIAYVENTGDVNTKNIFETINAFNKNNNFDRTKINLYPYLITMGNGNKVPLLEAFGKDQFYYKSSGIFHKSFYITSILGISENIDFNFEKLGLLRLVINGEYQEIAMSKNNIKDIIDEIVLRNQNETGVLKLINSSFDSIEKKYPYKFILGTIKDLNDLYMLTPGFKELDRSMNDITSTQDAESKKKKLQEEFNKKIQYRQSVLEV